MNKWIRFSPCRSTLLINLVIAVLATTATGAGEPLAQPLAWRSLSPDPSEAGVVRGIEYSGFSTAGLIYEINRTTYNIAVISHKPFWAPKPHVFGRIALWPANTLLIVHIAAGAPLTIDGKKVGFDQLAVGQTASVQYSIYAPGMSCGARRIDVSTAPPAKH